MPNSKDKDAQIPAYSKCLSLPPRLSTATSSLNKTTPAEFESSPTVDKAEPRFFFHSSPLGRSSTSVKPDLRRSSSVSHSRAFDGAVAVPLPLPLPGSVSLKSSSGPPKGVWRPHAQDPKPLPPPPPKELLAVLRPFSWEELAGACDNFSPEFLSRNGGAGPVYTTALPLANAQHQICVDITRIASPPSKNVRKWVTELRSVARLQHPHLCKVVGFYVHISQSDKPKPPPSSEQIVVYVSMPNGSLDRLLYGRGADKPPLDWPSRVKIALGAARGLAFLHEISPVQVAYRCFQTMNIQVDRDFNARLSDYCFARKPSPDPDVEQRAKGYLAPETVRDGRVFAKSNVWSFGVVLLEVMTGRQNMDALFPEEVGNIVSFCRPFLEGPEADPGRIMDPELKGLFSATTIKRMSHLIVQCLHEDVVQRPTMKDVENILRSLHNTTRLAYGKATSRSRNTG